MIPTRLKRLCLRIAKLNAPIDSGNLRHNAINGKFWDDPNRFTIAYESKHASYLMAQEDGWTTKKGTEVKGKHYALKTYLQLSQMLDNYYNWGIKAPRTPRFRKGELITNPLRELRHNKSLDLYKAVRGVNR